MSMRLLADHCVPRSVIEALRLAGHDVVRLKDCLPVESPDSEVIARAWWRTCLTIPIGSSTVRSW